MLRTGHKIFAIAADDNHNAHPDGSPKSDSFGGFTVIKAEKLEYRTITKALEDGHFYASTGPEIYELWYEDGKVHIRCSDAVKITMNTGVRHAGVAYPGNGDFVNEAEFKIDPEWIYFRLTVTDASGKQAWTSAYFIADLM